MLLMHTACHMYRTHVFIKAKIYLSIYRRDFVWLWMLVSVRQQHLRGLSRCWSPPLPLVLTLSGCWTGYRWGPGGVPPSPPCWLWRYGLCGATLSRDRDVINTNDSSREEPEGWKRASPFLCRRKCSSCLCCCRLNVFTTAMANRRASLG